ncbi:serine hydrolase domain-containing protein [Glutamicibacter protophormiae]|uniref:serine hydrolase domain-containing protein n=1 Tax=Glutamicibacter protophormiae TaxID=37930 RepID=UPI002A7ED2BA|nr:serine hydrolase domain-containing protein [Glutamicibacter protophormiae]WPR63945.1 serine hydrolase domain-containing protein [Glutamicibacter protophormiae]WPR67440.1 serine hydrolase domain-containing protein [Glutamicibacter protophormiae]
MESVITDDFAPLAQALQDRAAAEEDYSAQLAVYHRGALVLSHSVGEHLSGDALTCVFSCTKGLSALVIALLVQDGLIDPAAPITDYWPEFGTHGKGKLSVGEVLSHQAGVLGVPGGVPSRVLMNSSEYAKILATMPSIWPLGQNIVGYHAITMGVLMEELVRRVAGKELKDVFEERIRKPLGVDAYIGQDDSLEPRYRDVLPGASAEQAFFDPFSPAGLAVNSASGFALDSGPVYNWHELANARQVRRLGPASMGGVADAQSLAAIYAASFGPVPSLGATRGFLTEDTWSRVSAELVYGHDRTSGLLQAFALGFMKATARNDYGSIFAYGHDGANSSLAFADPAYQLGFAYIPSRNEGEKSTSMGVQLSQLARQVVIGKMMQAKG